MKFQVEERVLVLERIQEILLERSDDIMNGENEQSNKITRSNSEGEHFTSDKTNNKAKLTRQKLSLEIEIPHEKKTKKQSSFKRSTSVVRRCHSNKILYRLPTPIPGRSKSATKPPTPFPASPESAHKERKVFSFDQ